MLSDEQIERYSRQIILPQVGGKGQERLLHSRALLHARGPFHTAALHYLAAAGVGTIGLFAEAPDALLASLASHQEPHPSSIATRLNPDCALIAHTIEETRAPHQLVQDYDVVIADSATLHNACYETRRPFLYASVSHEEGRLVVCRGYEPNSPCFHCVSLSRDTRAPDSSLADSPLTEVAALFMGAHIGTEALKQLLDLSRSQDTKLLRFHFPIFHCTEEIVQKSATCPLCRPAPS